MLKKFPFGDSILKDLDIINPDKICSYSVDKIKGLAQRFPQVSHAESDKLDHLREEFMDFKLSPADHPVPLTDTQGKLSPGVFWYEVGNMKALDGDLRFPLLARLMAGLLSIPVSNADSEKGFSILRKIHTDQRPTGP